MSAGHILGASTQPCSGILPNGRGCHVHTQTLLPRPTGRACSVSIFHPQQIASSSNLKKARLLLDQEHAAAASEQMCHYLTNDLQIMCCHTRPVGSIWGVSMFTPKTSSYCTRGNTILLMSTHVGARASPEGGGVSNCSPPADDMFSHRHTRATPTPARKSKLIVGRACLRVHPRLTASSNDFRSMHFFINFTHAAKARTSCGHRCRPGGRAILVSSRELPLWTHSW